MMKLFVAAFFACIVLMGCGNAPKANEVSDFLDDALFLDPAQLGEKEPIASFLAMAKEKAAKSVMLKKDNVNGLLAEAKQYKHAFIVVGKHTLVKITDFSDCKKSTSWAADMPYGKALVQKNGLNSKSDYINNIIGVPDNQARWLLLFN